MFWTGLGRMGNSWREVQRLQDEFNRLFSDYRSGSREYPALNVWSGKDGAVVTAELPGLDSKAIQISVTGGTLTLQGKHDVTAEKNDEWQRRERPSGSFTRTVDLAFKIDSEKVEAHFRNGVLAIHLPRAEEDKPRKIAVKTA